MKLVIVGCGGMGSYQAKKFIESGTEIVGAVDHNSAHRKAFCERYGITHSSDSFENLSAFVGLADAISCATSDISHKDCCLEGLDHGFALFCEKPLGYNKDHVNAIGDAAGKARVPAMINFSKRNIGAMHALRNVVLSKALGDILLVEIHYLQSWVLTSAWGDWRTTPRWMWRLQPSVSRGGCLADLGSHLIDLLHFVFNQVSFQESRRLVTLKDLVDTKTISLEPSLFDTFFLESSPDLPPALVDYEGTLLVGDAIPCKLHCSQVASGFDDALSLVVHGSLATVRFDSTLSRNTVTVVYTDGREETLAGPAVLSTYELFTRWVDTGISAHPDLADGIFAQNVLEDMLQCQ
ncbi:putative dehydrogenase [Sphaerochaeta pleomorpha str. Grapes]|uniref:Putative dehydrogenase n=1 Tax=Sphaerochaeta pleomorpha (strain ATCC BAA-1885 / DSM 22778 / Grapes) TaxID=158190 RepID=G8QRQ7_SPHPG|nr:Gfo/Idh/MocA family oxidoreductase [Sphaerochaeta pleomorpha]AEV28840.1 putative dehydrogenase [Sphaerochaeta pleomorpha str. Grapes]